VSAETPQEAIDRVRRQQCCGKCYYRRERREAVIPLPGEVATHAIGYTCHRQSPPLWVGAYPGAACWPVVSASDWCGEFAWAPGAEELALKSGREVKP